MEELTNKNICFRVDVSSFIGTGHLMRCLCLADFLKKQGFSCHFLMRNFRNDLVKTVCNSGHKLHLLPSKRRKKISLKSNKFKYADWLQEKQEIDFKECYIFIKKLSPKLIIIDHYGIDFRWHDKIKKLGLGVIVIDDLADRMYNCDIIIDTTPGRVKTDYKKKLVNKKTKILVGSKYSIIREEFIHLRNKSLKKDRSKMKSIMVNFGGFDNKNHLIKFIKKLKSIDLDIYVTFITGNENKKTKEILNISKTLNFKNKVIPFTKSIAQIMLNSDLAISTPSVSSLERCCMGLPSIDIITSNNQKIISKNLNKLGASISLGEVNKITQKDIFKKLSLINNKKNFLNKMSRKASKVCNGSGKKEIFKEINYIIK